MHLRSLTLRTLTVVTSLLLSQAADANTAIGLGVKAVSADRMSFALPVLGPFAYVHFCMRYPAECVEHGRSFRRPTSVQLDARRWATLVQVNNDVNRAIEPMEHRNDTSFDTWRISPKQGDCNDYAVTKRHELLEQGWPSRSVLLSEVVTAWGEHHLVLLVRTNGGDFVLDNLHAQVRRWTQTSYRWVRVQSPTDPELWSTILNSEHHPLSS